MVSRQAIWMKKRYAEDPYYRDQQIARSLRHYWTHKDEINEGQRERYQADPEYRELKRKRGRRIPDDVYDVLFALQGGVCAICKKKHHRRLHADHCHVTGKLRGLLCPKCNPALGLYNDDPDCLLAAAAYLLASRYDLGAADPAVIAAEIAGGLHRRLEVLLREAFALRPEGAGRAGCAADRLQSPNKMIRRSCSEQSLRSRRWRSEPSSCQRV